MVYCAVGRRIDPYDVHLFFSYKYVLLSSSSSSSSSSPPPPPPQLSLLIYFGEELTAEGQISCALIVWDLIL
jgi:hypothetical protein